MNICLTGAGNNLQSLSNKLSLPIIQPPFPDGVELNLLEDEKGLWICQLKPTPIGPWQVDFLTGAMGFRSRTFHLQKQVLPKIIRAKKTSNQQITVVDLTFGWGKDAWILANSGATVYGVEANPVVAELVRDGLQRAQTSPVVSRIQFYEESAESFLNKYPDIKIDFIYMDPMYSAKPGSALPPGEMQILQRLVGYNEDVLSLLEICRKRVKEAVVVKRPLWMPPLGGSTKTETKSVRFEIFPSLSL